MSFSTIREFRPALFFLLKFIGLYLAGNILYGFYITSFEPNPDPLTRQVAMQTAAVLQAVGYPLHTADHASRPNTLMLYNGKAILSVYEGCNGLNTIIIFLSFLIAFGPLSRKLLWFIPLGLLLIHVTNLGRILLLFFVAKDMPEYLYFTHKYLFTAILYGVVFLLWFWWVMKYSLKNAKA